MKEQARELAKVRLNDLLAILRAAEGGEMAGFVEEAEQLRRSIDAFHMEAIRFRLHRLSRGLKLAATPLPDAAHAALVDVRSALVTAGLHIRSA